MVISLPSGKMYPAACWSGPSSSQGQDSYTPTRGELSVSLGRQSPPSVQGHLLLWDSDPASLLLSQALKNLQASPMDL